MSDQQETAGRGIPYAAMPFPKAETAGEHSTGHILANRTTQYDRELFRELLAADRRINVTPMSPNEITVAVNGYGSTTVNITSDATDIVLLGIPGLNNAGIYLLCVLQKFTRSDNSVFKMPIPFEEIVDNSMVADNFQQYTNLAGIVVAEIAGYRTTTTYVTGIMTGATITDLRNVLHWNREGIRTAAIEAKDYMSGSIQEMDGMALVQGPEALKPVTEQDTSITVADVSRYEIKSKLLTVESGDELKIYVGMDGTRPTYESNDDFCNYIWPTPFYNTDFEITIEGEIYIGEPADGSPCYIIAQLQMYRTTGPNSAVTVRTYTLPVPPIIGPAVIGSRNISYTWNVTAEQLGLTAVVGLYIRANIPGTTALPDRQDLTVKITPKGARKAGDFTRNVSVALFQDMPAGVTLSFETFRDYLGVPTSSTSPLLSSVQASKSASSKMYFNPSDALALANFLFNNSRMSFRVMPLQDYKALICDIESYATNEHIHEVAGSFTKFLKRGYNSLVKPAYKKVVKPAAKYAWNEFKRDPVGTLERGAEYAEQLGMLAGAFAGVPNDDNEEVPAFRRAKFESGPSGEF